MPERAFVTSIQDLDQFRSALLVYLSKARPLLEEACDEAAHTRHWLQSDRRLFWENQVRRRTKEFQEAQQTLFSAELANLREPTAAERLAVQRARQNLRSAEEKLKIVKRWQLEFDRRVEPLLKQLEQLRTLLTQQLPKAATDLAQTIKTLDAYTGVALGPARSAPPSAPSPPNPAVAQRLADGEPGSKSESESEPETAPVPRPASPSNSDSSS